MTSYSQMSQPTIQATKVPVPDFDIYAHHGRTLIQAHHDQIKLSMGLPFSMAASNGVQPQLDLCSSTSLARDYVGTVGILGAGPGGLYTALILEDLGIPYQILEVQNRVGGRLFTYKFENSTGAPYNYFDVGAMRFPKIASMRRIFHLFDYEPLNTNGIALKKKLNPFLYVGGGNNNSIYSYNGVTLRQNAVPPGDPFKAKDVILDTQPDPYIAAGTTAIMDDVIGRFAIPLLKDLETGKTDGWDKLMKYDKFSARAYMCREYTRSFGLNIPDGPLPTDVINWIETFDTSTGGFDRALSEAVLEAMAFGWHPDGENAPRTDWYCILGGAQEIAECMAKYVRSRSPNAITLNTRVIGIALNNNETGIDVTTITNQVRSTRSFHHVISTLPLPVLNVIDLHKANLSPMQANALRSLNYGPSTKIGLQFKTAWWTTWTDDNGNPLNIVGGISYTDRPLRTIVYPSFGNVQAGETTTLIASYCWTEDAERLGSLMTKEPDKELLKEYVLKELAILHKVSVDRLRDELIGFFPWSWSQDPYTMGAFAFFGPGKFENVYYSLNNPAGKGYLHFAGEAISVRHAWVEGALDSAWRAVHEMLHVSPAFEPYRQKFFDNWGTNLEWIKPPAGPGTGAAAGMPDPKDNLLIHHLLLKRPELFDIKPAN